MLADRIATEFAVGQFAHPHLINFAYLIAEDICKTSRQIASLLS